MCEGGKASVFSSPIVDGIGLTGSSQISQKPLIVGCIPAFNEEKCIAKVILLAQKYVDKVIVCDDGSSDMTGEIAKRLGALVIRHEKNKGYGASLRGLFNKARELEPIAIVTLDGDGQHNPEYIHEVVKPILDGRADVVIGSRFLDERSGNNVPRLRRIGIRLITNMTKTVSYDHITDAQSGYRAYSEKALSLLDPTECGMGASTEILMKAKKHGLTVAEVPVTVNYDEESNTHNPVSHGIGVVLSTIKHWSIHRPLVFYGVPGCLALIVAMGFWLWALQGFAMTRTLSTNITLVAVFTTIAGLVLLTTAIMLWVLTTVVRERSSY